jgi:hypothetical protein
MKEKESKNKGFRDDPINKKDDDLFDVKEYVTGLVRFIRDCDTPMTVAIQGDWGSGKTSFMNMIKGSLKNDENEKKVETVWFNTWKFSQFKMEENLPVTFLTYLMEGLSKQANVQTQDAMKNKISEIAKLGANLAGTVSSVLLSTDSIKNYLDEITTTNSKSTMDIVDELQKNFQELVEQVCEKKNADRIVFFIDDLDRLQPQCAVELLEVLKLFLDCEKCVFVLAIDYEVVSQGIKSKYKGTLDDSKSKNFFEKIIQVPFKMPTAHYKIDKYVENALKRIGIERTEFKGKYIQIIENSIGRNPRTMKRTFNAFLLLSDVHKIGSGEKGEISDKERLLLFACLCMQLSFEDIYDYIVMNFGNEQEEGVVDFEYIKGFQNGFDDESNETKYDDLKMNDEYDLELVENFLKVFSSIIDSEESYQQLRNILNMTSITSTGNKKDIRDKWQRKRKVLDEDFSEYSLKELRKEKRSTISCEMEWYSVGDQKYEAKDGKIVMADVLMNALEYAYKENPEEFDRVRHEALYGKDKGLSSLFGEGRAHKEMKGCQYKINTGTNNDAKIRGMCLLYDKLGIDLKSIRFSIKLATNE